MTENLGKSAEQRPTHLEDRTVVGTDWSSPDSELNKMNIARQPFNPLSPGKPVKGP